MAVIFMIQTNLFWRISGTN